MEDAAGPTIQELFIARSKSAHRLQQKLFWHAGPEREEERVMRPLIAARPKHRVKAGDAEALKAQGYRVGECHRNCIAAAAADSTMRHVFGWTVHADYYVSHSVLQTANGAHVCITPEHTDQLDIDGRFEFIEDDQITCDGITTFRSGKAIGPWWAVIRRDAEKVGSLCADLESRVRNGELSYDEAMAIWNG